MTDAEDVILLSILCMVVYVYIVEIFKNNK